MLVVSLVFLNGLSYKAMLISDGVSGQSSSTDKSRFQIVLQLLTCYDTGAATLVCEGEAEGAIYAHASCQSC